MANTKKYDIGGTVEDDMPAYVGNRLNVGKDRGSYIGRLSKEDADLLKSTRGKDYATLPKLKQENLIDAVKAIGSRLKDNIMGTEEQNAAAEAREIERARRNPEGMEAKFRKATGKPFKSGGKVSSASKRADGCCTKGKTKGRFV